MIYRIITDYDCETGSPVYKDFYSATEANNFIQNFYETTDYGVACVESITEEMITICFDIV